MLAKRRPREVPLLELTYNMGDVPRCAKDLAGSCVVNATREEVQDGMAEVVLLCSEAVKRQALHRHQEEVKLKGEVKKVFPSKPLSIEFIADRLETDDPFHCLQVRTEREGYLQGLVTWTTFTEWQRHFHWDSVIAAAQLHDTEGDAADRKLDTDGMLAAELQNTIYEGDPEDQGVVWPHIAEIGLLGGLGCGRWLAEAAIEEMERAGKYKYVVLQATSNSVSFYETIGFVRVGAVARYSVHQKDAPPPTEAEALNFNKTYVSSPTRWYTDTKEDETPRQIAAQLDMPVEDLLFMNRILYGSQGLAVGSRLKKGTPLRVPVKGTHEPGKRVENSLGGTSYTTEREKETPKTIAAAAGVSVADLVKLNKARHKNLSAHSILKIGTQLFMPNKEGGDLEAKALELAKVTDEVAYRHWTFIDDEIEFTEASYMMCRRLNPKIPDPSSRKKSAEPTMLNSLGHRYGTGQPNVLRIPLGCSTPEVFEKKSLGSPHKGVRVVKPAAPAVDPSIPPPPKKPKKFSSAYFCYSQAVGAKLRKQHAGKSNAEVCKLMGETWRGMSDKAKAPYLKQAAERKAVYNRENAAYLKELKAYESKYSVGKAGKGKGKNAAAPPRKLFNKVVSVKGRPGPWFVLTYIPDLQWCHVGPLFECGVFGNDKKGEVSEATGKTRWMLSPEGTAEELDVSAFNCTVLKSKTVRKVQDADKEEWYLLEEVPALDGAAPSSPRGSPRRSKKGGATADAGGAAAAAEPSPMEMDAASPEVMPPWLCPSGHGGGGGRPPATGLFRVGDLVTGKWSGKGGWYPGRVTEVHQGAGGSTVYSVLYEDGDFEKYMPPTRLKLQQRSEIGTPSKNGTVAADEYKVGDVVLGDWKGRGKMYQGWITEVHDGSIAAPPTYTLVYEDGDTETLPARRIKRANPQPNEQMKNKRRRVDVTT